jgi:formate dehydrogenase major subunit
MDSYNTGVQSGRYSSPRRIHGGVDLAPEDAHALEVTGNDTVRVTSRRGSIDAPVRLDRGLRPGLAFMSIHFPDDVDVNQLTIDSWDPRSGTAEFKATAVRIEKVE